MHFFHKNKKILAMLNLCFLCLVPVALASSIGLGVGRTTTPLTFSASDGTTNLYIESTLSAADYLQVQAGATGTGAALSVASGSTTDAPLTLSALGAGSVRLGNGDFLTPIVSIGSYTSFLTYPEITRYTNASSLVSLGIGIPDGGSFTLWKPGIGPGVGNTGGNRSPGTDAVDLQLCYTSGSVPFDNTRVASGPQSIAAGCNNTASGTRSATFGGNFNIASGTDAFIGGGQSNSLSGAGSAATGYNSGDFGVNNTRAHAGGSFAGVQGDAQFREHVIFANVTGTGATRLTVGGAAAGATTVPFVLSSNERSVVITCDIIGGRATLAGTHIQTWTFGPSVLRRPTAGVGSTALSSTTVTAGTTVGTVGTIAVTASADTTNGALNLSATASDDLDWHVVARCKGVDVK